MVAFEDSNNHASRVAARLAPSLVDADKHYFVSLPFPQPISSPSSTSSKVCKMLTLGQLQHLYQYLRRGHPYTYLITKSHGDAAAFLVDRRSNARLFGMEQALLATGFILLVTVALLFFAFCVRRAGRNWKNVSLACYLSILLVPFCLSFLIFACYKNMHVFEHGSLLASHPLSRAVLAQAELSNQPNQKLAQVLATLISPSVNKDMVWKTLFCRTHVWQQFTQQPSWSSMLKVLDYFIKQRQLSR
jgi:hypothetical protein